MLWNEKLKRRFLLLAMWESGEIAVSQEWSKYKNKKIAKYHYLSSNGTAMMVYMVIQKNRQIYQNQ